MTDNVEKTSYVTAVQSSKRIGSVVTSTGIQTQKSLTQAEFESIYKINNFETQNSTMLGNYSIAILDFEDKIQMFDDNSTLVVSITNNNIAIKERLIDPSGALSTNITYRAVDGLFNIPLLRV